MWGGLAEAGSLLPPLGLCYLAAVTRNLGHQAHIIDSYAEKLDATMAADRVCALDPDIVGISSTTQEIGEAARLAAELKIRRPGAVILLGGVHVTSSPVETFERYANFDVGFAGEAEASLPVFLKAYQDGGQLWNAGGLILRRNHPLSGGKGAVPAPPHLGAGEILMTPRMKTIDDLDELPIPAFDLLPELKAHYSPAMTNYKRSPVMGLVSSRGCPGHCTFCDQSVFGNRIRMHSAERIMEIITLLMTRHGIREINFYDDTFVAHKARVRELCQMFIDRKLDLTWSCNARVNLVNEELLRLMARAGCWQISYGIETGEQTLLDSLKKKITLEQVDKAVNWSKEAGMMVKAYYMIGLPGETRESLVKTRRSALGLPLDDICLEFFTPFPGTELYVQLAGQGVPLPDWENMNTFKLAYVPPGLDEETLRSEFKGIIRKFYLRPRIIWGYLKRFASPRKMLALARAFVDFIRTG